MSVRLIVVLIVLSLVGCASQPALISTKSGWPDMEALRVRAEAGDAESQSELAHQLATSNCVSGDTTLPIVGVRHIKAAGIIAAVLGTDKTPRPARFFKSPFTLRFRPELVKKFRQAHARLKLNPIHRHDRAPVGSPGDIMQWPVAHIVSLAEYSC